MQKKMNKHRITIVGSGYVGMSLAVLLARYHFVSVLDIDPNRVDKINKYETPVVDDDIEIMLKNHDLKLKAMLNESEAYTDAEFIIIATPTNYDQKRNSFDTTSVDTVVKNALRANSKALIVIKSTIPIGYTEELQNKYKSKKIIFSPEFLREGKALYDNLNPSRIIIGSNCSYSKIFGRILLQAADKKNVKLLFTSSSEAESIKLFSNAYLALRVSFFNELDSFALSRDLDSKNLIDGVSLDERIGQGYNNPSFGYGGYCLPKDTKQLLAEYSDIPKDIIQSIVSSNSSRKSYLADKIIDKNPKVVGCYRLVMKEGSDNFRSSAILDIMDLLSLQGIDIVIFEPSLNVEKFLKYKVCKDIDEFKVISDVILANRKDQHLEDVNHKCFSRDIYGTD